MFTLIKNGEIYTPEYLGNYSILLSDSKIVKIGDIDEDKIKESFEVKVVNAKGMIISPGIIDPHVHLIGGGGEGGFSTRTPEIQLSSIIKAGVTTVVGCLGTDGTTRHMTSLLAKARGLEDEGITSYIYTGNYHVPTPTITSSVKEDIILIDKVIGTGEIAISDSRSAQPSVHEIAKLAAEARIGGLLSKKAGVIHFHVGIGKERLNILRKLINDYEIPPANIYATHITRSKRLVDEAIEISNKGCYVDITADKYTAEWIKYFKEQGGNMNNVTVSSDGNGSLPVFDENGEMTGFGVATQEQLFAQIAKSVKEQSISVQEALSLITSNTSTVLRLENKGRIVEGIDADILLIKKETLEINHVFAKGKHMMKDGDIIVKGTFE